MRFEGGLVRGVDGRRVGIDRQPGALAFLGWRSRAFVSMTQRRGAPMVFGGKAKDR